MIVALAPPFDGSRSSEREEAYPIIIGNDISPPAGFEMAECEHLIHDPRGGWEKNVFHAC